MTDIVERLNAFKTRDHARLCQGREYVCSCGYDSDLERTVVDAAAEITDLRARADEAETERDILHKELTELGQHYSALRARAEAAEKERDELKVDLEQWKEECAKWFAQAQSLNAYANRRKARAETAEALLAEARAEMDAAIRQARAEALEEAAQIADNLGSAYAMMHVGEAIRERKTTE